MAIGFTAVKKIGSGQVFTTLQGWEDAAPVNYTTAERSAAGSFLVGAFIQNETLNFVGAGAVGKFLDSDSTGAGNGTYISYAVTSGNPSASDVVTGATSGATCVLSSNTPIDTFCVWQGQGNAASDSFTGSVSLLTISGGTVSANGYAELTTAAGASFRDNANKATNALKYNAANGLSITSSGAYISVINIGQDFCRFSKLQIEASADHGQCLNHSSGTTQDIDGCIFENQRATNTVFLIGANVKIRNSLVVCRGLTSAETAVLTMNSGASSFNCTVVTPSDKNKPTAVISHAYGSPTDKNGAFFFGTALKGGGATPTYTTCANDNGSPPSGVTQMTYNTSLFNNITDATRDFRTPTGSGLRGAGTTDATNALVDIYGTTRVAPYDIGCWQSVGAAAGVAAKSTFARQAVNRASTY